MGIFRYGLIKLKFCEFFFVSAMFSDMTFCLLGNLFCQAPAYGSSEMSCCSRKNRSSRDSNHVISAEFLPGYMAVVQEIARHLNQQSCQGISALVPYVGPSGLLFKMYVNLV